MVLISKIGSHRQTRPTLSMQNKGKYQSWSDSSQNLNVPDYRIGNLNSTYCKVSNIRRTLVGNKIVDHSDVVGASPVGAAPTTSSFST